MMHHLCVRCQSPVPATRTSHATQHTNALVTEPTHQDITTTCSRRLRHEHDFLDAVDWTLAQELHPHANNTTRRIAQDLASRMHRSKDGHVAYGIAGMIKRLRLARSTITKHTRILRELGLLAWVVHGDSTNILRTRLADQFTAGIGYRGTATIYAPCAPPAFDAARGQLRGGQHGYQARIRAVTNTGRQHAIARATASTPRTPSCDRPQVLPAPTDGGGKNNTRARPRTSTPLPPNRSRQHTPHPTGISPQQAAAGMTYAQHLRYRIWWLQGTCTRQLAYALRPLIAAGLTVQQAAQELSRWTVTTRPTNAVGYIRTELRRRITTGELALPDIPLAPLRDLAVDDEGARHTQMLSDRFSRFRPAYLRYLSTLAGPLRAALRRIRQNQRQEPQITWKPQLREPESEFWRTLPASATPAEIYAARAHGHELTYQPAEPTPQDLEQWARQADEAEAEAAFRRLRARLERPQQPLHPRGW